MGCYYSIADYHHPVYEPKYQNRPHLRTGTRPGADITKYIDFMFGQLEELCESYHPCLIWFDGGSGFSNPAYKPLLRRQELVEMLHSYGTISKYPPAEEGICQPHTGTDVLQRSHLRS